VADSDLPVAGAVTTPAPDDCAHVWGFTGKSGRDEVYHCERCGDEHVEVATVADSDNNCSVKLERDSE